MIQSHGVLLVDKVSGITSHDVVDELRKLFDTRVVGHAGTLDPLATGLLVCLLGEATKLSQYVMNEAKSYQVDVKLGIKTDSGDITGQVVSKSAASGIERDRIEEAVASLVGDLNLPVPKYSAVKVGGKKLYEYARLDEEVALPTKVMTISRAQVTTWAEGCFGVEIDCAKGTYVRSWVEKLGDDLGCGATVQGLRRTRSGCFEVEKAHRISDLKKLDQDQLRSFVIPMSDVLGGWPALRVLGRDLSLVQNGQIPHGIAGQIRNFDFSNGVRLLGDDGGLLALVVRDQQRDIRLARVFGRYH